MRILLVEDDKYIGQAVQEGLTAKSFAVDWFKDGDAARYAPQDVSYDCILLDLGLPGIDGVTLLREWRRGKVTTPVIILTARDALTDRVGGLDQGADDYMVKPFELAELLARIRAVMRRASGNTAAGSKVNTLTNGVITLDVVTREVQVKNEDGSVTPAELTSREFALLQALMQRPGAVLSREALEDRIYSYDDEIDSNAVEYLIYTLRRKIGAKAIKNVRGAGWKVAKAQD